MVDSLLGLWLGSQQAPPFRAPTRLQRALGLSRGLLRVLLTQDLTRICKAQGSILFLPLAPSFLWPAPAPGRQQAREVVADEETPT